jgi:chromosome segregation ATPase
VLGKSKFKMKQTITSLFLLSFLAIALPASAQRIDAGIRDRATTITNPTQIRAEVKARIDARLASSTLRRASSTARRVELQQSIAKRQADHAGKKLLATIERLEKLADRIESRIEKVEALGGNASTSERFLAEARAHLSEARVALEAFSSVDLSGTRLAENFERVRAAALEVKEHLRLAHRNLVNAILSLKPGRTTNNAASDRATTTTP